MDKNNLAASFKSELSELVIKYLQKSLEPETIIGCCEVTSHFLKGQIMAEATRQAIINEEQK